MRPAHTREQIELLHLKVGYEAKCEHAGLRLRLETLSRLHGFIRVMLRMVVL